MHSLHVRFYLSILVLAALAGCATKSPIADKSRPLLQSSNGLALASVALVQSTDSSIRAMLPTTFVVLKLRRLDVPGDENVLRWSYGELGAWQASPTVLVTSEFLRAVTTQELAPGAYNLFGYEVYAKFAGFVYTLRRDYDRPLSFTIRSGQVTYVGSHEFHFPAGKNLLGMSVPGPVSYSVKDRFTEDLQVLQTVRPEMAATPTSSALQHH